MRFDLSESIHTPSHSGCYLLTNFDGDVIYIGQSNNLYRRMQEHLANPRMTARTRLGYASWFYYGLWEQGEIIRIESEMLFQYQMAEGQLPPLNRR